MVNVKFIYSEKATKLCETLLLSYVVPVKSKVKILQNFVAFSECINGGSGYSGWAWAVAHPLFGGLKELNDIKIFWIFYILFAHPDLKYFPLR